MSDRPEPPPPRRAPLAALALMLALALAWSLSRAPGARERGGAAAPVSAPVSKPSAPPPAPGPARAARAPEATPQAPAPSSSALRPAPRAGQRLDYFGIDEHTRDLFFRQFKVQRGAELERCLAAHVPPSLAEVKAKGRRQQHESPPVGAPFTRVHVDLEIDFEPYTDGYAFGSVDASTTALDFVGPEETWTVAIDDPSLAACVARAYADVRVPVRGVAAGPQSKLAMRKTLALPVNPQE